MKTLPEIQLTDRATMLLVKHMDANPHLSVDEIVNHLICNALAVYEHQDVRVGAGFQLPTPPELNPDKTTEVDQILNNFHKMRNAMRNQAYTRAARLLGVEITYEEDNWNQIIDALEAYRPDFRTFTLEDES